MTLAWTSTATIASCRLGDSVFDEANGIVRFVEFTNNTMRNYDVNTGLQIGSNINLGTNPYAICMVSSASALVAYNSGGNFSLIEVPSNYVQTYTSTGSAIPGQSKGQQMASDQTLKIAFWCGQSANVISKLDSNTFTRTNVNLPLRGSRPSAVILKSSGRWLVGSDTMGTPGGMVVEIDSTGAIVDSMELTRKGWVGNYFYLNGSPPDISYMSYGDNILVVGTESGEIYIIDWSTKTIIDYFILTAAANYGTTLSNMADGLVLTSGYTASNFSNALFELDPTIGRSHYSSNPLFLNDSAYTNVAIHVQQSTGKVIISQVSAGTTTTRLIFGTLTSRASTTTTFTVQDPPGTDIKCRLWLIQDDGTEAATNKVILDTYMQSPATYRVPTGKTIRALVKYGEGNNAKYQMSVITT